MGCQQRALLSLVVVVILVASASGRKATADLAVLSIQYVQVTSLTDRGFFVTWTTDQTVASGSVLYGTSPGALISLVPETMGPRGDVHRVFIQPAAPPGTTVYFDVKSGSTVDTNGGSHYKVTLGQPLGAYPSPVTVAGQVLQSDGRTPAVGVLVTIWAIDYGGLDGMPTGSTATSLPLSAITDSGGIWRLLLETRTLDSAAFFKYTTNGTDQIKYSVAGGGLGQISATISPLSPSASGQVSAPTVSLIGSYATPSPTLTVTNGPVPTNTPTITATTGPSSTATVSATMLAAGTPTEVVQEIPTTPPVDTDTPTPEAPIRPPLPTSVPATVLRVAYSPTASAPPEPAAPNLVPATAGPLPTPAAVVTLFPRPVLTEGAGAWPDRSTPTATPSPVPGTLTPLAGGVSEGAGPAGPDSPAGVGLLLFIGAGFLGLGSLGVAIAVAEARRAA